MVLRNSIIPFVCAVFSFLTSPCLSADDFSVRISPYVWLADTNIKAVPPGGADPLDFEIDGFQLLSGIEIGGMIGGEVQYKEWLLLGDFAFGALSLEGVDIAPAFDGVELGINTQFGNLFLGREVLKLTSARLDAIAGVRILSPDIEVLTETPAGSISAPFINEDFIDPVVGARFSYDISDRANLFLLSDVGGFGVGSKSTWQIYAGLTYALRKWVSLEAGYRIVHWRFDDTQTQSLRNVASRGPLVGVSIYF